MERKRKLQFVGDSYFIALPPDWIHHWELEKGDFLNVSAKGSIVSVKVIPKDDSPISKILRDREKSTTRKLQYISKTFYISLPPAWIREQKLKKSDILSIKYSNSDIVTVSA